MNNKPYAPAWGSLIKHATPQWFNKDANFGIYTHWGVYSVPAKGPNVTWYPVWCKNSIHNQKPKWRAACNDRG